MSQDDHKKDQIIEAEIKFRRVHIKFQFGYRLRVVQLLIYVIILGFLYLIKPESFNTTWTFYIVAIGFTMIPAILSFHVLPSKKLPVQKNLAISEIYGKRGIIRYYLLILLLIKISLVSEFILANSFSFVIISIVLVLLSLHKLVTDFRIQSGYFGNNVYEAQEVIKFILNNKDDIDFRDSDGNIRQLNPKKAKSTEFELNLDWPPALESLNEIAKS